MTKFLDFPSAKKVSADLLVKEADKKQGVASFDDGSLVIDHQNTSSGTTANAIWSEGLIETDGEVFYG